MGSTETSGTDTGRVSGSARSRFGALLEPVTEVPAVVFDGLPSAAQAAVVARVAPERLRTLDAATCEAVLTVSQTGLNTLSAVQDVVIAAAVRREELEIAGLNDDPRDGSDHAPEAQKVVASALASIFHIAPRSMATRVGRACKVVDDLPVTLAAALRGQLEAARVAIIADGALNVAYDLAFDFDVVLHSDPRVTQLVPGRLRRAVERAAEIVDEEAFAERARAARRGRFVGVRPGDEPGLAYWTASLSAEDSAKVWAAIDALAREYIQHGDRTIDQARADALVDLILGHASVETVVELVVPTFTDTGARPSPTAASGEPAGEAGVAGPGSTTPGTGSPGSAEPESAAPDEPESAAPDRPESAAPDRPESAAPDEPESAPSAGPETATPPETAQPATSEDVRPHMSESDPPTASEGDQPAPPGTGDPATIGWLGFLDFDPDQPVPLLPVTEPPRPDVRPTVFGLAHFEPLASFMQIGSELFPDRPPDDPDWAERARSWWWRPPRLGVRDPRHGWLLASALAEMLTDPDVRLRITRADALTGVTVARDPQVYRPNKALARRVRDRDRTCRFPGCGVAASRCDLDHVVRYPDGSTSEDNLLCLCRAHHGFKHHAGWRVVLEPDGTCHWISPTGRVLTSYPADLRVDAA